VLERTAAELLAALPAGQFVAALEEAEAEVRAEAVAGAVRAR
jgi:hypothetical protein